MPRRPHISDLTCAIGLVLSVGLVVVGPPGTDLYAHEWYLSMLAGHHGIWNPWWYSGQVAFVGYSIIPYLLAWLTSLAIVMVAALWVTVLSMRALYATTSYRPARVGLGVAMVTWPLVALSGDVAYVTGVAFAALAGLALLGGHKVRFVVGAVCALLSSALAVFFLGMVIGVVALARILGLPWRELGVRGVVAQACRLVATVDLLVPVGLVLIDVVVARGMDLGGRYPFFGSDLLQMAVVSLSVVAVLVLSGRRRVGSGPWRLWIFGALTYLAVGLVTFPIADTLGSNVARVSEVALPIAAAGLVIGWESRTEVARGLRRGALAASLAILVVSASYWNLATIDGPLVDRGPTVLDRFAGWTPVTAYLLRHLKPGQRVEVVDTASHAASYFLPKAGIPLMRGWYRQLDFPFNSVLYGSHLSLSNYLALLSASAVAYVVVPPAPYDFSAAEEPALVTRSHTFHYVGRFGEVALYRVVAPTPLIPGGRVLSYGYAGLSVRVPSPGRYVVSLRYSPYLVPSAGCIRELPDGRIAWEIPRGGVVSLHFHFALSVFVSQEFAGNTSRCA